MNFTIILKIIIFGFVLQDVYSKTKSEWQNRRIYQLLTDRFNCDNCGQCNVNDNTYCGGTYKAAIEKLPYIKELGFNAIWISPPMDNVENGFHGYWPKCYDVECLNPHFGDAEELKEFIIQAHSLDIWVMVDVIANHVGVCDSQNIFDYSCQKTFNKEEHFHKYCTITDFEDQKQVEVCRLVDLPDLNQDNTYVRSTMLNWIGNLVSTFDFDGIRIDTVPEVHPDFWDEFREKANVFQIGEVFNGRDWYVSSYQNHLDSVFAYPLFFSIRSTLGQGNSLRDLETSVKNSMNYPDPFSLATIISNHDNPRFLANDVAHGDTNRHLNAITFMYTSIGIPVFYYGDEQGYKGGADPKCREALWESQFSMDTAQIKNLKKLNLLRGKYPIDFTYPPVTGWIDDQVYSYFKGGILIAITNVGSNGNTQKRYLPKASHPYKSGQKVCNIYYPSDCIVIDNKGQFLLELINGESKVFVDSSIIHNF
eukprot:TRINITY_DN2419_c1_g1_i1.p1 TRINITY_DN2419_c1_g1~~TRINITY_DN2419_c1_g1_i1.p1  ORF type:complete len:479 (-),score=83.93 TRINITY_DN2419_c1_g1_i1:70-1506(-)